MANNKDFSDANFTIKCKHLWHTSQIYCLTFDRSGRYIFTGGDDGLVKVYSTRTDRLVRCLSDGTEREFVDELVSVCQSIDFEDENLEINLESETEKFAIQDIAVNYENTLIAAAKYTGSIPVWNLNTFECVIKLEEQVFPIRSIRFSPFAFAPNRKYLISTSTDGFVYFYAYNDRTFEFTPKSVHRKTKYDGDRAVSICGDVSTGGLLYGIVHTFGIPVEESMRPLSKRTPLSPKDIQSAVRIINLADDSQKEEWKYVQHKTHAECEYSFRFCHNSFRFATGCDKDSNAFIWTFDKGNKKWDSIIIDINAKGNKKILRGKSKQSITESVYVDEFIFSCDDKYLIMSLTDNSIKVWNAESGELVRHFENLHTNKISVIEYHPKLDHICLSAGYDSRVFVYDILKGVVVRQFDCNVGVNRLQSESPSKSSKTFDLILPLLLQCQFSPDGLTIAATDNLGNMTVFTSDDAVAQQSDTMDQFEAELLRIHSESENSSDSQSAAEVVPAATDKDMSYYYAIFEFELDLLRGVEKPSPAKLKSEDKTIDEKDNKVIKTLTMKSETKAVGDAKPKSVASRSPAKPVAKTTPRPVLQKSNPKLNAVKRSAKSPQKAIKRTVAAKSSPKEAKPSGSTTTTPMTGKPLKEECKRILDDIFENPNSIPFQMNDHIKYPDYRKEIVDADLSLSSIRVDLMEGRMKVSGFNSHMNAVFENAKTFYRKREEEVYDMAVALEEYYCKKMADKFGDAFKAPKPVADSDDEDEEVECTDSDLESPANATETAPKVIETWVKVDDTSAKEVEALTKVDETSAKTGKASKTLADKVIEKPAKEVKAIAKKFKTPAKAVAESPAKAAVSLRAKSPRKVSRDIELNDSPRPKSTVPNDLKCMVSDLKNIEPKNSKRVSRKAHDLLDTSVSSVNSAKKAKPKTSGSAAAAKTTPKANANTPKVKDSGVAVEAEAVAAPPPKKTTEVMRALADSTDDGESGASKATKPMVTPKRKPRANSTSEPSSASKRLKTNGDHSLTAADGEALEVAENAVLQILSSSQPLTPQRKSSQESLSNGVDNKPVVVVDKPDDSVLMDDLSPNELIIVEDDDNSVELVDSVESTTNGGNYEPECSNSCDIIADNKKSMFCLFCDQSFADRQDATAHYVIHMCPLKCVKCCKLFATYDQYLKHGSGGRGSCPHPKSSANIEWSRHYNDTIVWINNFLEYQLSDAIVSAFDIEDDANRGCVVCQKLGQLKREPPAVDAAADQPFRSPPQSQESHIEKHLKYETQYQCLVCSLTEDQYFYCRSIAQATHHMKEQHHSYLSSVVGTDGTADNSGHPLQHFDRSIPKLDDIVIKFNS